MNYYKIEIRNSFILSYKFHIKVLANAYPNYAINLSNKLRKSFKVLQFFPFSNPILKLPDDDNIYRKIILDKKYHIIYIVKNNIISILYFSDGRQAPDTYFNLLNIFK